MTSGTSADLLVRSSTLTHPTQTAINVWSDIISTCSISIISIVSGLFFFFNIVSITNDSNKCQLSVLFTLFIDEVINGCRHQHNGNIPDAGL